MLEATFGDGVGEGGGAPDGEGGVLDLDPALVALGAGEQQVDATVLAVLHLALGLGVAGELGDQAGDDVLVGRLVGQAGVDVDPVGADLDGLKDIAQLARRAGHVAQHDLAALFEATLEAAGVRAVRGDDRAVLELHVGEEALVAAEEGALDRRLLDAHGARG